MLQLFITSHELTQLNQVSVFFDVLLASRELASELHGSSMSVNTDYHFGLVLYNHANFYRFEETYSHWSVKRISVSLLFIGQLEAQLTHHCI